MSTPGIDAPILVVNAGSSSIKFAVFDGNLNNRLAGIADGIGGDASLKIGTDKQDVDLPDHVTALQAILHGLEACDLPISGFRMAAHRVVHGGSELTAPVRITSKTRLAIANCTPLAPLHNPHHLSAIDTLAALAPDLAQYASFDTGFHATMPKVETTYALPTAIAARGLRRYGFHGISYASLVRLLPELSGAPLPDRLLAFHLGNGVSACAIRKGHSVATTMGYSPLEGLTMGTRTGDIDANAVLRLAREDGIEATAILLNRQSGLRGLSGGTSDMRALLDCETPDCGFAVEHFCYHAVRHAGALIAAMQGCDAIAFTGGIGENAAPIRRKIMEGLAWLGLKVDHSANENNSTALHTSESSVAAWIIPAQEERMIAADALQLMQQEGA